MDHKTTEAQLLQAMASATTLAEQQKHAADLAALREERATRSKRATESMWADNHLATAAPTPHTAGHTPTTASSDWLADVETVDVPVDRAESEMRAQASRWYGRIPDFVKENADEVTIQAVGFAQRTASQYGSSADKGVLAFIEQVKHLAEVGGHPAPHVPGENAGESTETSSSDSPSLAEGDEPEEAQTPTPPVGASEVQNLDAATWPKEDWNNGDLPASGNKEAARRRIAAKFNSYAEAEAYVDGLIAKNKGLAADADAAYDRQDQAWFNAQSDEDLAVLWEISRSTFFAPYDDEVHDALSARGFDFEGHDKSMGYTASRKTAAHWEELTDPSDPGIQSRIYEMDVAGGGRMQVQQNLSGGPVLWHFISPEGYYTGASGRAATVEEAQTAAEWSAAGASGRLASRKTASGAWQHEPAQMMDVGVGNYPRDEWTLTKGQSSALIYTVDPAAGTSAYAWTVDESPTNTTVKSGRANSLEEAKSAAEAALDGLGSTASRKTASISLKNVGIDGPGVGIGTDPSGKRVKFRLSEQDEKDLKSILFSDMAINFSGVDIEESDVISEGTTASRRTASRKVAVSGDQVRSVSVADLAPGDRVFRPDAGAAYYTNTDGSVSFAMGVDTPGRTFTVTSNDGNAITATWDDSGVEVTTPYGGYDHKVLKVTASRKTANDAYESKSGFEPGDRVYSTYRDEYVTIVSIEGGKATVTNEAGETYTTTSLSKEKTSSRKTAAPKDGQRSYCRICGVEMEGHDYAWYALKSSTPKRDVGQHHHLPARNRDWPGEFNAQGDLVPGTPGGGGGQYDAPAGTIYDAGGNAIRVASRRKTASTKSKKDLRSGDAYRENGRVFQVVSDPVLQDYLGLGEKSWDMSIADQGGNGYWDSWGENEDPKVEYLGQADEVMGLPSFVSRRRTAARIDTLRGIVQNHQAQDIDGMLVDAQTANLLVQVYDAVSDKAKFEAMPLQRLVDFAWQHVGRQASLRKKAMPGWRLATPEETKAWLNGGDFPVQENPWDDPNDDIDPDLMVPNWLDLNAPGFGRAAARKTASSIGEMRALVGRPSNELEPDEVPDDHPVRPLTTNEEVRAAVEPAICGTCGLIWDDGKSTSWTPTPSGRCPFEYFHWDDSERFASRRKTAEKFKVNTSEGIFEYDAEDADAAQAKCESEHPDAVVIAVSRHVQAGRRRTAAQPSSVSDHDAAPEWPTATAYDLCNICGWPVTKKGDGWAHDAKNPQEWTDKRKSARRRTAARRQAAVGDPCWSCDGKGYYRTRMGDDWDDPYGEQMMEVTCSTCGGSGVVNEPTDYPLADDPIFTDRFASLARKIQVGKHDAPALKAMTSLRSIDQKVGGLTGRQIVAHVLATGQMDQQTRKALTRLASSGKIKCQRKDCDKDATYRGHPGNAAKGGTPYGPSKDEQYYCDEHAPQGGVRHSEGFDESTKKTSRRRVAAATCVYSDEGNCSDDVTEVWHGEATPLYLCGFHSQKYGVNAAAQKKRATASRRKTAEVTNSWSCQDCGATVERWRGEGDVRCPNCGASYNAVGQRLRDDWRGNPSTWDENISDLEGYEMQHARWGSRRKTAAARPLHQIAAEIQADWQNVYFGAVPYLDVMSVLDSIDGYYGADSARGIVAYFLSNASSWRGEKARAIKKELKALLDGKTASRQHTAIWPFTKKTPAPQRDPFPPGFGRSPAEWTQRGDNWQLSGDSFATLSPTEDGKWKARYELLDDNETYDDLEDAKSKAQAKASGASDW